VDVMWHTGAAFKPGVGRSSSNPLRGILNELLDPGVFGQPSAPELIVAAMRVRTGEARLFRDAEVTVDVLLASACLPQLFPAIEIDGDGGYTSNPPLPPLIEAGAPADVLIIRAKHLERPGMPAGAIAVQERVNETTSQSSIAASSAYAFTARITAS